MMYACRGCTHSYRRMAATCSTTLTSTPITGPRPPTAPGARCSANPAPERNSVAGRGEGPDFVEALARGLDILASFDAGHRRMSLTDVATATGLARPTARRLLLTLEEI